MHEYFHIAHHHSVMIDSDPLVVFEDTTQMKVQPVFKR